MFKKFFADFKAFAMKGNVVDMAIGVVVGGAFGKVVTSVVNDLISPLIGLIAGGAQLSELKWVMRAEVLDEATGEVLKPAAVLTYGAFLQTLVDFLIIAFSIFVVIRIVGKASEKLKALAKKPQEEAPAEPEAPKEDELSVLKEIRELLSADKKDKKGE